jgi:hypothetical protein
MALHLTVAAVPVLIDPGAANADAGSRGCVTRAEYKAVKKGWTKTRVDQRFGTKGHKQAGATSGGFSSSVWTYKTCSQFSAVAVSYDKRGTGPWKLAAKSAVWVS